MRKDCFRIRKQSLLLLYCEALTGSNWPTTAKVDDSSIDSDLPEDRPRAHDAQETFIALMIERQVRDVERSYGVVADKRLLGQSGPPLYALIPMAVT